MVRRTQDRSIKGPSAHQWARIRNIFTHYWMHQGKSLKEVQFLLDKQYGFTATERMYKRRMRQWGLGKYLKESEIIPLLITTWKRRKEGKHSEIRIRGSILEFAEVRRYIKRKKITDLRDVIAQAADEDVALPSGWTCSTPDSSYEPDDEDERFWSAIEPPQDLEEAQTQLVVKDEPSLELSTIWPTISPPGDYLHVEHLLFASSTFFDPFSPELICTDIRTDLTYSTELQEFEGHLRQAGVFADSARWASMRTSYGKAMDLVPVILRGNQSLNFLICLFVILACCKTQRRLVLVPTTVCFIAHSAAHNLPARHPFCQIIHAIHDSLPPHHSSSSDSFCSSSASTSSTVSADTTSQPNNASNTIPTTTLPSPPDPQLILHLIELSLQTALDSLVALDAYFDPRARIVAYGLFETLFATGQYHAARALMRETWRKEEAVVGRLSHLTLWSMMAVGRCGIELGEVEEGERVLGEVVSAVAGHGGVLGAENGNWVEAHVRECSLLSRRSCVHRRKVKELLHEDERDVLSA